MQLVCAYSFKMYYILSLSIYSKDYQFFDAILLILVLKALKVAISFSDDLLIRPKFFAIKPFLKVWV